MELVKRDIQQKYMGSYLGLVWIFLQPLIFISILYFVFTFGLRVANEVGVPFSVYLVSGIVAWLYFAENFGSTTYAISEYAFLVKRVDFRLSILPVVKIISSLVPHFFLVMLALTVAAFEGFHPTLYTLQLLYYLFALSVLVLGLGWLTSSTSLFVKDVANVVNVLVQFGFWITPVFWNINIIPEKYRWVIKLNPIDYIVTGYRDSIVGGIPFWEHVSETIYFWTVTSLLLLTGAIIFKRLRPHFAEVI